MRASTALKKLFPTLFHQKLRGLTYFFIILEDIHWKMHIVFFSLTLGMIGEESKKRIVKNQMCCINIRNISELNLYGFLSIWSKLVEIDIELHIYVTLKCKWKKLFKVQFWNKLPFSALRLKKTPAKFCISLACPCS